MDAARPGLLLINLGTPESPAPRHVRPYLRQFLSDPRVLDMPALLRWLVLNLLILPRRPKQSGAAYAKIWTERGSPLLVHGLELTEKVRARLEPTVPVALAMRYGEPSIEAGLGRLVREGARRVVVFPLYPQYSSAATGSSLEEVFARASGLWNVPNLQVVPPFYDHPAFLDVSAVVARPHVTREGVERVFFSFHGLPERHVRKSDTGGGHCLTREDCCARIVPENRDCYRAQCFATAEALGDRLGVPRERRVVCFQSRLGRDPWIRPYTDECLAEAPRRGVRRAVILSPAFVADCLETLEELAIRGVETWREAGGESLDVVPCLNARDDWADAVVEIVRDALSWPAPRPVRSAA